MLFPLLLLASLACAKAKEPADVSLLSWKDYREKVMQLPLIEAALADSTQSEGMRGLMRACMHGLTRACMHTTTHSPTHPAVMVKVTRHLHACREMASRVHACAPPCLPLPC